MKYALVVVVFVAICFAAGAFIDWAFGPTREQQWDDEVYP